MEPNEENIESNEKVDIENVQEEKFKEQEDRLKRLLAEFENFKKRSAKEREQLYNSIISDIITNLLPVIDNLENAINAETKDDDYKEGTKLVLKQFLEVLSKFGVQPIISVGQAFDPEFHEAVTSVVDEALGEKIVKEEFRKGYKIGSRVIRHAMVSVAN